MATLNQPDKQECVPLSQWQSFFDIDDHTIRVVGSSLSGREWVYIDGKLLSKKTSWSFVSTHIVEIDGKRFEIVIELLSMYKPQIRIQVFTEQQLVDQDYVFKKGADGKNRKAQLWLSVLSGFVSGFVGYWLVKWLIGVL